MALTVLRSTGQIFCRMSLFGDLMFSCLDWSLGCLRGKVLCVCVYVCVYTRTLSHVQLHIPMDCSPPGSSVHRIFQARILELTIFYSRESSWTKDQTRVSCISCIDRRIFFFTTESPGKPMKYHINHILRV